MEAGDSDSAPVGFMAEFFYRPIHIWLLPKVSVDGNGFGACNTYALLLSEAPHPVVFHLLIFSCIISLHQSDFPMPKADAFVNISSEGWNDRNVFVHLSAFSKRHCWKLSGIGNFKAQKNLFILAGGWYVSTVSFSAFQNLRFHRLCCSSPSGGFNSSK